MNKGQRMIGLWVGALGILISAKAILTYTKSSPDHQPPVLQSDYSSKPAPAVYYKKGDPAEITFTAIDLGTATNLKLSEQSDLLYRWHDDKTLAKPRYRLRRKDGTITNFPLAKKVFLTPGGKVFAYYQDANGCHLDQDGKMILAGTNASPVSTFLQSIETVTDEAIFFRLRNGSISCKIGTDMSIGQVQVPTNATVLSIRSSSGLGTFLSISQKDPDETVPPTYSYAKFVLGRLETQFLHLDFPNPTMTMCKDHVYLVSDTPGAAWQMLDLHNRVYSRMPAIPNTAGASLVTANSSHDFIFGISEPTHRIGNAFELKEYFVTGGKYFALSTL